MEEGGIHIADRKKCGGFRTRRIHKLGKKINCITHICISAIVAVGNCS